MRPFIFLVFVGVVAGQVAPLAADDVYRRVDETGAVEFTDKAAPDAEKVTLPELNRYTTPPPQRRFKSGDRERGEQRDFSYQSVAITAPEADSAFWDDGSPVAVSVSVKPALAPGHGLQLVIDGEPLGEPGTSTQFMVAEVNRGTHTLVARVTDATGDTVIESPPSQFTLHQRSVINQP